MSSKDASKKSTGLHKSHNSCFGEGKCSLYLSFLYILYMYICVRAGVRVCRLWLMCVSALIPSVLLSCCLPLRVSPPAVACSGWKEPDLKMKGWEQEEEGAVNKGGRGFGAMRVCSCIPECPVVHPWREEWDSISIDRSWVEALCWLPYAPLGVHKKTNTATHSQHAAPLWCGDTDQCALSGHWGSVLVKPCGDVKVSKHEVTHVNLFACLVFLSLLYWTVFIYHRRLHGSGPGRMSRTEWGLHIVSRRTFAQYCRRLCNDTVLYAVYKVSHCALCSDARFTIKTMFWGIFGKLRVLY